MPGLLALFSSRPAAAALVCVVAACLAVVRRPGSSSTSSKGQPLLLWLVTSLARELGDLGSRRARSTSPQLHPSRCCSQASSSPSEPDGQQLAIPRQPGEQQQQQNGGCGGDASGGGSASGRAGGAQCEEQAVASSSFHPDLKALYAYARLATGR